MRLIHIKSISILSLGQYLIYEDQIDKINKSSRDFLLNGKLKSDSENNQVYQDKLFLITVTPPCSNLSRSIFVCVIQLQLMLILHQQRQ